MFQPFVENSIIHGFEGMEKGGMIRILIDMDGERLRVRIEDNGCGMKRETALLIREILDHRDSSGSSLEPDPAGGPLTGSEPFDIGETEREGRMGVGIRNVVTRMRMFFGPRFEAELWTEEGKGTSFTFRLPIPDFEEDFVG
jgi:sensor histidine kinase YesM